MPTPLRPRRPSSDELELLHFVELLQSMICVVSGALGFLIYTFLPLDLTVEEIEPFRLISLVVLALGSASISREPRSYGTLLDDD